MMVIICQSVEHSLITIVHIPFGKHEVDDLAALIAYQVELEAIELVHHALADCGITIEHLVAFDALAVSDGYAGAVFS